MATKKPNAGVGATAVAVSTPEKTKSSAPKKSSVITARTTSAAVAPKKSKKTTAKKSPSKKSAGVKKARSKNRSSAAQPTAFSALRNTAQPVSRGTLRWTLIDVGEVYLATIFFSLVMLGIIYWVIALAGVFQSHVAVASATSHFVFQQVQLASAML